MDIAVETAPRRYRVAGRTQTIIVMAITIVAIGAISWYVSDATDGVTSIDIRGLAAEAPTVGNAPPGFSGVAYDGTPVTLASYSGKALWLTFGASWCRDCRAEAADLQATYAAYRDQGLNVLGVFIGEPASDVAGYAQRAGLTFPIIVDQNTKLAAAYRILGIPTHVFIGADGQVRQVKIGALSKADMEQAVQNLLR